MKIKNNIFKIALLTSVSFALSTSLLINLNVKSTEAQAASHADNYSPYYYSGNYYSFIDGEETDGMNGTLRQDLTSNIFPKHFYSYYKDGEDHLSTQLQFADEDPTNSNNMVYFYTRDSVTKNAAKTWNREHVWCQSLSSGNWGTTKGGTDLLHLRPTYNDVNSTRNNYPYGETDKSKPKTYNGIFYGYLSGGYFEPLDSVKGDVARIIMYLWTTYKGYYANELNITNVIKDYNTLLRWHTIDRPDLLEGNRNDYVQSSGQQNRNPFVDHPEYAWRIFGSQASESVENECMAAYPSNGGSPIEPTGVQLDKTSASVTVGNTLKLKATLQPAGAAGVVSWSSSNTSVATVSDNGLVTANSVGSATITAFVDEDDDGVADLGELKATCTVTVNPLSALTEPIYLDYTSLTGKGAEIDSENALSKVGRNNAHIRTVATTKIYDGNGNGGALADTAGLLKTGTSSAVGRITFTLDGYANKVRILCHDFYKKDASHQTNNNSVNVNGSGSQLAPFNESVTFETLTFDLNDEDSEIEIVTSNRIFIKNIEISYEDSSVTYYTVDFNSNGGTSVESQMILEGDTVQEPTEPIKASDMEYDYSFDGWYDNSECAGDEYDFNTPIASDLTLYAKWNQTERSAKDVIESKKTRATLSYAGYTKGNGAIDELDNSTTGVTNQTYTDWENDNFESGVKYAGKTAGQYSSIQMRTKNSNEGLITIVNTNNLDVKKITIRWNSNTSDGRVLRVYGKNTAYSAPADLFDDNTQGTLITSFTYDKNGENNTEASFEVTGSYKFIGLRSGDSALFIDSIDVQWGNVGSYEYEDIAIRFGGLISTSLWDRLDTNEHLIQGYGVMISYDEVGIQEWYDAAKTNQNTIDEAIDEMFGVISGKDYYFPLTNEKTHPAVAIDSQKVGEPEGDYYVWNLYKKVSNQNLTKFYTAVAYIRTGDDIIFLNEITASTQSLANDMIESGDYDEESYGGSLYNLATLQ